MASVTNYPWLFGLAVALLLALFIEAGQRIAAQFRIREDQERRDQIVAIRDGLFLLVSLLLGFTLALVVPRYGERRSLLIEETNAIGTTYLRAAVLPPPTSLQAQQLLRQYVDARLELDLAGGNSASAHAAIVRAKQIQEALWQGVINVTASDRTAITAGYMTSLNQLIDLHEQRLSASEHRIPAGVWLLLISVSVIAVFTRGLTLVRRFWLTLVLVPLTIAIVVALIADLDTPNAGIIRLDQRAMERLKADIAVRQ